MIFHFFLSTLDLWAKVMYMGPCAFADCTSLRKVTIPDCVLQIAPQAFARCASLMEITIPNSVLIIGESAFEGCCSFGLTFWLIPLA